MKVSSKINALVKVTAEDTPEGVRLAYVVAGIEQKAMTIPMIVFHGIAVNASILVEHLERQGAMA